MSKSISLLLSLFVMGLMTFGDAAQQRAQQHGVLRNASTKQFERAFQVLAGAPIFNTFAYAPEGSSTVIVCDETVKFIGKFSFAEGAQITHLQWSPRGRFLAALASSLDGSAEVVIYDAKKRRELGRQPVNQRVQNIVWGDEQSACFALVSPRGATLFDCRNDEVKEIASVATELNGVGIGKRGDDGVYVIYWQGTVSVMAPDVAQPWIQEMLKNAFNDLCILSDSTSLGIQSNGEIQRYEKRERVLPKLVWQQQDENRREITWGLTLQRDDIGFVSQVLLSPCKRFIALKKRDTQTVEILDTATLQPMSSPSGQLISLAHSLGTITWSDHGNVLLTQPNRDEITVFNTRTRKSIRLKSNRSQNDEENFFTSAQLSPDEQYVLTHDANHRLQLWNSEDGRLMQDFGENNRYVWTGNGQDMDYFLILENNGTVSTYCAQPLEPTPAPRPVVSVSKAVPVPAAGGAALAEAAPDARPDGDRTWSQWFKATLRRPNVQAALVCIGALALVALCWKWKK